MYKKEKISILIIEDNAGDQVLLYENLKATGLSMDEIVMVDNLEEGKIALGVKDFALVFLDLFLPDSKGLDSLQELIKINNKLPVIIYSGLAETKIALKAIALGAQDFLIKGQYDNGLLEKAVRYSIERKGNLDALQESLERYSLLSKATHDMVWDWNLVTHHVARNKGGWEKIFKSTVGETGNKEDWPTKVHPDDKTRVLQAVNEAILCKTTNLFEEKFRIIRDDGAIGFIEDRGYIIRNENGKATRVIGASHDVTEQKSAQEKVLSSERRFRSLIQNSSDLVSVLDGEGKYSYVSGASKKILGYDPEFFIGKSPFTFMHEEDVQDAKNAFADLATKKNSEPSLVRFKTASGTWRWIESSIANFLDDPDVAGIVINSRDVTEKKIAADELIKLSMLAKETINGVIISDEHQNITWINNAFTRMFEYGLKEIAGRNINSFLYGTETRREAPYNLGQFVNKRSSSFEVVNHTKSGKRILAEIQVQPIFDERGNFKQSFALVTDITNQRFLEENVELEKKKKQKEITNAVFAAQENERSEIGRELHDNVNQLLGAIHLYIEMSLKNEPDSHSLLTSASAYTMDAIEEIRKLSKTLVTPHIKEVGLSDLVKDLAEDIMKVHPVKIHLTANNFSDEYWNDKFELNIFRIIQEQLNNILKHAHALNIFINIGESGGDALLSIEDDGVGFDTTKKSAGIGITNIKSRAELFNGILLLNSQPGKGTKLFVTFKKNTSTRIKRGKFKI